MKTNIDVKTVALNRALALLGSLGAQYKIILPDGGGEYGELEAVAPKKGTKYGYGALRDHVRPVMQDMKPGDVVDVPVGAFDPVSIQSSVGSYASDEWGAGAIVSTLRRADNVVQVLRVY